MSRYGQGRHRQSWVPVRCDICGQAAAARRTLPGRPLYLRTHFDADGELCPPLRHGETRMVLARPAADPNQLSLFA